MAKIGKEESGWFISKNGSVGFFRSGMVNGCGIGSDYCWVFSLAKEYAYWEPLSLVEASFHINKWINVQDWIDVSSRGAAYVTSDGLIFCSDDSILFNGSHWFLSKSIPAKGGITTPALMELEDIRLQLSIGVLGIRRSLLRAKVEGFDSQVVFDVEAGVSSVEEVIKGLEKLIKI